MANLATRIQSAAAAPKCGAQKTNTQNTIICRQPDRALSMRARRNKHSPSKRPDDAHSLWLERCPSDCLIQFRLLSARAKAQHESTARVGCRLELRQLQASTAQSRDRGERATAVAFPPANCILVVSAPHSHHQQSILVGDPDKLIRTASTSAHPHSHHHMLTSHVDIASPSTHTQSHVAAEPTAYTGISQLAALSMLSRSELGILRSAAAYA